MLEDENAAATRFGNQPTMLADVAAVFADARATEQGAYGMTKASEVSAGHGRLETRSAFVVSEPEVIAYLNERGRWSKLRSVALVGAERTVNSTTTSEQRFYLLNQIVEATTLNTVVRRLGLATQRV